MLGWLAAGLQEKSGPGSGSSDTIRTVHKEGLHNKFRERMPSMSVALKVSAQNHFEFVEAPVQETHVTEEVGPQSMDDLFEMNARVVSSGNVWCFTAAWKIPMMRTQQPRAFGRGSEGGTTRTEEGARPPAKTT